MLCILFTRDTSNKSRFVYLNSSLSYNIQLKKISLDNVGGSNSFEIIYKYGVEVTHLGIGY